MTTRPRQLSWRASAVSRGGQGAPSNYKNPPDLRYEPAHHGLGRSRGGLSTKCHALVDGRGRPLVILVGPGQDGDSPMLPALLASLRVPRLGPGRPRSTPAALLGDKAYSARAHRAHLRGRRITTVIPERADQTAHRRRRGSAGGRPVTFDAHAYRGRNVVERAFNRIKNWRGLATRYEKHATTYRGRLLLAAILLWLQT